MVLPASGELQGSRAWYLLPPYARARRCPVLTWRIVLPAYATSIFSAYKCYPISPRIRFAVSGPDVAFGGHALRSRSRCRRIRFSPSASSAIR
eukprot:1290013-Rhodomonas_salina.1